jgi:regulation of enolase protein 1 (concanavalin A-like superfamily)
VSLGSANASIGTVNPAGSGSLSKTGIYTVAGSGLGITGTADKGHFYYDKLTGDGSIIAKVLTMGNTNASAKAGIMIRESLATGSKNMFLAFTPNGTVNFQRRTATNGSTSNTTVAAAGIPSWIKLTRVGNTFTAYRSADGKTWTAVGTATTNTMTSAVFIGLAVSSNTSNSLCTATFRNVTLTGNITRL